MLRKSEDVVRRAREYPGTSATSIVLLSLRIGCDARSHLPRPLLNCNWRLGLKKKKKKKTPNAQRRTGG